MIYIAKCPLRVGLIGGSTDLEEFIQNYGFGKVISFPSTLHVYISVHDNNRDKYILNYSVNEEVDTVDEIKNDVARLALKHFNVGPITVSFLSDIISTGSGLASSSAFMIAMVKALSMYTESNLTEFEICKLALQLEREFNPITGYQDVYGCGIGGFKKIEFKHKQMPSFVFYSAEFVRSNFDMALYHTGIIRNSTKILESYDLQKSYKLLEKVDEMAKAIGEQDPIAFLQMFNLGWQAKKETSPQIVNDPEFRKWEIAMSKNEDVLGVKLCGAGGGGYFFTLCKKGSVPKHLNGSPAILVDVSETGVVGMEV